MFRKADPANRGRKLTAAEIVAMRERRAAGEGIQSLADAFRVCDDRVFRIVTGKRHVDAGGPITAPNTVSTRFHLHVVGGAVVTRKRAAAIAGINYGTLSDRLEKGWEECAALATPPLRFEPSEVIIPPGPSTAYIRLRQPDEFACVDIESIPLVEGRIWYKAVLESGHSFVQSVLLDGGYAGTLMLNRVVFGAGKGDFIQAINGNYADCRKANLRSVTSFQKQWRMKRFRNNTSGYKGVSWHITRGKWAACLQTNGKRIWLGWHSTAREAALVVDREIIRTRGDLGRLNFPEAA